jgi:uncharacterized protein
MNPVNHFEIPFDDEARATKFYSKVFDWQINAIPEMKYVMAHTAPTDEKTHMLKEPGAINGGMYKRDDKLSKAPVIVITVPNLDEHLKKIEEAGGSIFMPKVQVGDMGFYAQVKDTEGNIIGVWENIKKEAS